MPEMSQPKGTFKTPAPLPKGTIKPLTPKQLRAIQLRVDGNSWEQISQQLEVTIRTIFNWRQHPDWDRELKEKKESWIEEYEMKFTRMMPRVAHTHIKLLHSPSEAIQMRAVDSAHANHGRLIREQDTKSEVEELKEMVRMLMDQLKTQGQGG